MTSRREFIRISVIGAGALAAGSGVLKAMTTLTASGGEKNLKVDLKRTPTYCEVCWTGRNISHTCKNKLDYLYHC